MNPQPLIQYQAINQLHRPSSAERKYDPIQLNSILSGKRSKKAQDFAQSRQQFQEKLGEVDSNQFQTFQEGKIAEINFNKRLDRMYKYPASVIEALVHQRATKNGYNSSKSYEQDPGSNQIEQKYTPQCPCCQNFVNTVQLPLSYSPYPRAFYDINSDNKLFEGYVKNFNSKSKDEKKHIKNSNVFEMQNGTALFLCFIKLVIIYLIIRFLMLDAYNIFTNFLSHFCLREAEKNNNLVCHRYITSILSTANKDTAADQQYFVIYDILSLSFVIFSIGFFLYGRVKLFLLYENIENRDITEDDYSILIQDIPSIPYQKKDQVIKNFDINIEYKEFLQKLMTDKIRVWLNQLYTYSEDNKDNIIDNIERQFFDKVFSEHRDDGELFDQIVSSVNLCYDLSELEHLEEVRSQLMNEFLKSEESKQFISNSLLDDQINDSNIDQNVNKQISKGIFYISHIPHQIKIINRHYIKICQKISFSNPNASQDPKNWNKEDNKDADYFKLTRFVGKAFVSFRYQHYKHYILNQYYQDKNFFQVNGNKIKLKLSPAPKPNDIYWKNMKVSDDYRRKQIRNSYLLALMILAFSFIIIYLLRYYESKFVSTNKKNIFKSLFLLSMPVCTFIINYILDWALNLLNTSEKHQTKTKQLSSHVIKSVIATFMNTSVIYAGIYFIRQDHLLASNGLVNTLMNLVIISILLNVSYEIIQPYYIYLRWGISEYEKAINTDDCSKIQPINKFQVQLNKELEYPPYHFSQAYSYYLQMICITSFFGYLVPITTLIIIIGFMIQYWIDKYNLLKKFSSPIDLGYDLTDLIWKCLQATIILIPIGQFAWGWNIHRQFKQSSTICNFLSLTLSVVYLILIFFFPKVFQTLLFYSQNNYSLHIGTYTEEVWKFTNSYQGSNPATSFISKTQVIEMKKKANEKNAQKNENIIITSLFNLGQKLVNQEKYISTSPEEQQKLLKDNADKTIKWENKKIQIEDFSLFCNC